MFFFFFFFFFFSTGREVEVEEASEHFRERELKKKTIRSTGTDPASRVSLNLISVQVRGCKGAGVA